MINTKNNFAKALIFGCAVFSSITILKAQTGACFTSLNDYSYTFPGDCPGFTTCGDINGDGKPDLVTTTCTNKIITLIGTGNGTFNTGISILVGAGTNPLIHRLKDINGDGKLDVVTLDYGSKDASILLGTGTGSFVSTGTISCGWPGGSAQMADLRIADVNNDTKQDIVVPYQNGGASVVTVMLGNGAGAFGAPSTYTTGGNPWNLVIDDLNNDGNQDLLMSSGTNALYAHYGNGTGSFSTYSNVPVQTAGWDLTTADFNNDGKKDIATAHSYSNSISISLGNGAGGFTTTTISNFVDTPFGVTAADMDADGKTDLVVMCDGSINYMKGNGNGTFSYKPFVVIDMNSNLSGSIGTADLNLDGKPDVFACNAAMQNRVFAVLNKGGNLFGMPDIKFPSVSSGGGLVVEDLNADGKQDLISSAINAIDVAMGTGSGNFAAASTYTSGATGQIVDILYADFNNDGKKDIVAVNAYPHSIAFMAGNGAGVFTASGTVTLSVPPYDAKVGDFNNDGNKDLALSNYNANTITIYSGNGTGTFALATTLATLVNPAETTIGDYNNDGNADIAYGHFNISNVYVVMGTGANAFSAPVSYITAGNAPINMNNKDVNGDGRTDLIVADYNSGPNKISVLLGTASGTFQPATFYSTSGQGKDIVVEDMNGDGFQDIVTGNYTNSDYSVLLGSGTGTFASPLNYPIGRVYSGSAWLGVKDMNNDGTKDVIIRSYINSNFSLGRSNVTISYNNSAVITSVGSGTICLGNTITLHASANAFSYMWNPGGSTVDSLVVSAAGVYSVTVVNPSGTCSSTASKTITVVVCTGINGQQENSATVMVYPNPNNGEFAIKGYTNEDVIISNELGQVVKTVSLKEFNNYEVRISDLPIGIYFLKGQTINSKVVVIK